MAKYTEEDCIKETKQHIDEVRKRMVYIANKLLERALVHDDSKMKKPELDYFVEFTPKLKGCTYGTDEYKGYLKSLNVALTHHYEKNSHHPEHYEKGVNGMDLLDLIEMLCDWKAATLRHADGDMDKSIEINKERFKIDEQLVEIFKNTLKYI